MLDGGLGEVDDGMVGYVGITGWMGAGRCVMDGCCMVWCDW